MFDTWIGPFLIMAMRVGDVSLSTMRTIFVVQGKKYLAGFVGFFEVLIWFFAINLVFEHLDNYTNLLGYAAGFSLGNIIGITFEQKIGFGYIQLTIISRHFTDQIANSLRKSKYGVTILPGEGGSGGISVIVLIIPRKQQVQVFNLIESIDKEAFITVQHSLPYRGFIYGPRR